MREGYTVEQVEDVDLKHVAATVSNFKGLNVVSILCWHNYDESTEAMLSVNLIAVFKIRPRIPMPKP